MQKMWEASEQLEALAVREDVPRARAIPLCKTCSLAGFCGHD
ncbi:Uncharacterized protein dnm_042520 [Desulfonema magnum]|uniref:CRISPR-associated protein Cas4 n=1 Tax=Desulfonema magnum TaxID=45655 RepID=A0A975BNL0_9BACT|nr:Uncharacterized protein dnm_042520 [Desulfonema magnum]